MVLLVGKRLEIEAPGYGAGAAALNTKPTAGPNVRDGGARFPKGFPMGS